MESATHSRASTPGSSSTVSAFTRITSPTSTLQRLAARQKGWQEIRLDEEGRLVEPVTDEKSRTDRQSQAETPRMESKLTASSSRTSTFSSRRTSFGADSRKRKREIIAPREDALAWLGTGFPDIDGRSTVPSSKAGSPGREHEASFNHHMNHQHRRDLAHPLDPYLLSQLLHQHSVASSSKSTPGHPGASQYEQWPSHVSRTLASTTTSVHHSPSRHHVHFADDDDTISDKHAPSRSTVGPISGTQGYDQFISTPLEPGDLRFPGPHSIASSNIMKRRSRTTFCSPSNGMSPLPSVFPHSGHLPSHNMHSSSSVRSVDRITHRRSLPSSLSGTPRLTPKSFSAIVPPFLYNATNEPSTNAAWPDVSTPTPSASTSASTAVSACPSGLVTPAEEADPEAHFSLSLEPDSQAEELQAGFAYFQEMAAGPAGRIKKRQSLDCEIQTPSSNTPVSEPGRPFHEVSQRKDDCSDPRPIPPPDLLPCDTFKAIASSEPVNLNSPPRESYSRAPQDGQSGAFDQSSRSRYTNGAGQNGHAGDDDGDDSGSSSSDNDDGDGNDANGGDGGRKDDNGGDEGKDKGDKGKKRKGKQPKKKAQKACLHCQKAHLTCDDSRPCQRCVKKGMADSCVEGHRKIAKYLMPDAEDNRAGHGSRSSSHDPSGNGGNSAAEHALSDFAERLAAPLPTVATMSNPLRTANSSIMPSNSDALHLPDPQPPGQDIWQGMALDTDPLMNGSAESAYPFDSHAANLEYSMLSSIFADTAPAPLQAGAGDPPLFQLDPSWPDMITSPPYQFAQPQWNRISSTFGQHTISTGSDHAGTPSAYSEQNPAAVYSQVVKPYDYTEGYHHLMRYLAQNFDRADALKVVKSLAAYRPSLIALQMPLTTDDEVFVEKSCQRTLIELEKLVSWSGTPTAVWRRTGEICVAGEEFCKLVRRKRSDLVGKKTYIYELFDKPSTVRYFDAFSQHAFENTTQAYFLRVDMNLDGQGIQTLPCSCSITVRRDVFDLPSLVIGQILPIEPQGA